jgi:GNAT superfamily N-acetyltransferase
MLEMHAWRDALITIGAGRLHCFLAHLLRLGPEERLQRFCHRADDACLRAYVASLDLGQCKIIGCFEGEQMRGAAELRALGLGAAPSRLVEATFSLEKDWCGQGVERALIVRAITAARSMGARQLFLDRLGSSEALRRAVMQFDADMVFGDDDCRAWLPLTPV